MDYLSCKNHDVGSSIISSAIGGECLQNIFFSFRKIDVLWVVPFLPKGAIYIYIEAG